MNDILKIFYEVFIPGVIRGFIDIENFLCFNIAFNMKIGNELIETKKDDELVIPTLTITNKDLFDKLLVKYIEKCLKFYSFPEEIENNEKAKIGEILVFLFANATIDDFENPISFLKKKINFLENETLIDLNCEFTSKTLSATIKVKALRAQIISEAPYKIEFEMFNDEGKYNMPNIYVGIEENKAYIYAIQRLQTTDNDSKNSLAPK